jgi:AraC-like DNA-binding protein
MLYLSHIPRAPLNEFVERLWFVAGGDSLRQERILPSGTVELVINLRDDRIQIDRTVSSPHARTLPGVAVSGTYSEAFIINAVQHAAMMGVHFRPGGASAVLGVPAVELANAHVDLAAMWGGAVVREMRERLCAAPTDEDRFRYLEHVLIGRLRLPRRQHPAVALALASFTPAAMSASVRDVARQAGLSYRRLLTVFRAEVGLPPKLFCRIQRFRHVHELAQRPGRIDWTQIALECGFFDQSHLANEFRMLAGITPSEYQRGIGHIPHLLDGHVYTH